MRKENNNNGIAYKENQDKQKITSVLTEKSQPEGKRIMP